MGLPNMDGVTRWLRGLCRGQQACYVSETWTVWVDTTSTGTEAPGWTRTAAAPTYRFPSCRSAKESTGLTQVCLIWSLQTSRASPCLPRHNLSAFEARHQDCCSSESFELPSGPFPQRHCSSWWQIRDLKGQGIRETRGRRKKRREEGRYGKVRGRVEEDHSWRNPPHVVPEGNSPSQSQSQKQAQGFRKPEARGVVENGKPHYTSWSPELEKMGNLTYYSPYSFQKRFIQKSNVWIWWSHALPISTLQHKTILRPYVVGSPVSRHWASGFGDADKGLPWPFWGRTESTLSISSTNLLLIVPSLNSTKQTSKLNELTFIISFLP